MRLRTYVIGAVVVALIGSGYYYVKNQSIYKQTQETQVLELETRILELKESLYETDRNLADQAAINIEQAGIMKDMWEEFLNTIEKPTYEYLKSVTVVIQGQTKTKNEETGEEGSMSWVGTGSIVKIDEEYTYILTNKHVAPKEENTKIYVKRENPNASLAEGEEKGSNEAVEIVLDRIEAEVLTNDDLEIALIRIKGKLEGKQAIKGLGEGLKISDRVYVCGHHLGKEYTYGEGVYANDTTEYDETGNIQVPTLYGNSGSAVFNQKGELVGLVYAVEAYPIFMMINGIDTAHGLILKIDYIKKFLQENLK